MHSRSHDLRTDAIAFDHSHRNLDLHNIHDKEILPSRPPE
jgi:hypothetical protein